MTCRYSWYAYMIRARPSPSKEPPRILVGPVIILANTGAEFRVLGLGFRIEGLGCRIWGVWFSD